MPASSRIVQLFAIISALILCGNAHVVPKSSSNLNGLMPGNPFLLPQQIHLAYGETPDIMFVTWSTYNATINSIVAYGVNSSNMSSQQIGTSTKFVDGGSEHRFQYIHRVRLGDLSPGQKYFYKCGSTANMSSVFYFTAMRSGNMWSPRFAMYGDMGLKNARSLNNLISDSQKGMYDAILHVGDFAYDMDSGNSSVGDGFLRNIQPLAGRVPYMTTVGNHEQAYNFSNYKARFSMPGSEQGMMYSYNVGPIHIISVATEFYFYLNYGFLQIFKQYEWLEQDLKEATKPDNRAERPWIIVLGHRPMYCSNNDKDDCTKHESVTRVGIPYGSYYIAGMEKLFYKYGVDMMIWAHEHSYERLWPIYDFKVYNGSFEKPYTNPKAPVHVVTGSAGCQEDHDGFLKPRPPWSAFRSLDYGYTRLNVYNATHLYWEQVSDDKGGVVIDKTWLIKDYHGPYTVVD